MRNRGAGIEQGRHAGLPLRAIAVAVAIGALAPVAIALWATRTVVYTGQTLAPRTSGLWSERVDTIVVSDVTKSEKVDQLVLRLVGTSNAASADSQFYAVARWLDGGPHQTGSDSLILRPDPPVVGVALGEARILSWVSDTLEVRTRNPMATDSVTGTRLTATRQRLK